MKHRVIVEFEAEPDVPMLEWEQGCSVALVYGQNDLYWGVATAVTPPKLEILHQRDPDSGCVHTVFVDGAQTQDYDLEDIDPGAGYEGSDWDERLEATRQDEDRSPAFRDAAVQALEESADSQYIDR